MTTRPVLDSLLVDDRVEPCPYVPNRRARLPLRLPLRRLDPVELDVRLAAGDRRHGRLLYCTECRDCRACESLRIPVREFEPSSTHRRVFRRGRRDLQVELGPPVADAERLALYNAHLEGRGLARAGTKPIGEHEYRAFLVERCCDSFELRYRMGGRLVGVAVTDRAARSLSAVYCAYDPTLSSHSLGTFSILVQIDLARTLGLEWLYLGYYIAESPVMRYKARFFPHERLVGGDWRRFTRG